MTKKMHRWVITFNNDWKLHLSLWHDDELGDLDVAPHAIKEAKLKGFPDTNIKSIETDTRNSPTLEIRSGELWLADEFARNYELKDNSHWVDVLDAGGDHIIDRVSVPIQNENGLRFYHEHSDPTDPDNDSFLIQIRTHKPITNGVKAGAPRDMIAMVTVSLTELRTMLQFAEHVHD